MAIEKLFGRINRLARIFGWVLIVLGVFTFANSFSSGEVPSDTNIGFKVWLAIAGITTIFAIRKKTIMRRVIAGLTNGFICCIAIWMIFAATDDYAPVKRVLGGFLLVACGLSVIASLLPYPHVPLSNTPDIIKRHTPDTTE